MSDGALSETHEGGRLPSLTFTTEQVELIKRTVAQKATNDELALFLHTCKRTGLDPLVRQIHFVKRKSKHGPDRATFQVGIDGYRLVAQRTNECGGNDDPIFDDEATPRKATVTVYRIVNGVRCPYTATARWDQYHPGDGPEGFMWRKMPHLMLGKCAEALALRKAFPAELSGVYTHEEMQQAGPVVDAAPSHQNIGTDKPSQPQGGGADGPIGDSKGRMIYAKWKQADIPDAKARQFMKECLGAKSGRSESILASRMQEMLSWIEAGGPDWELSQQSAGEEREPGQEG